MQNLSGTPGGRKWLLIYPKYEVPKFLNIYVNVNPDCLLGLTNLFLLQLMYMFFFTNLITKVLFVQCGSFNMPFKFHN